MEGGEAMDLPWKVCFRAGVSIFLLYLCIRCWPGAASLVGMVLHAALPLFVGCGIAYVVNIPMSCWEGRWRWQGLEVLRRPLCMLGAYLALAGGVGLLVCLVLPELSACVQVLLGELPGLFRQVTAAARRDGLLPPAVMEALGQADWDALLNQGLQVLTSGLGGAAETLAEALSSLLSWVGAGVIGLVFSVYLLANKEALLQQGEGLARRWLKPAWWEKVHSVARIAHQCFRSYITGQCAEAVILGLLCTGGMLLLRLPYAGMIGALTGFAALIPVAGAYLGGGLGAVMLLTVSPAKALLFLAFLLLLQQVEGNLIYPKVVGASVGLPGLWVMAAVTIGGGVLGVVGMLLGVPLAAVAYQLFQEGME